MDLTLEQAARLLGVDQSTLTRYELGERTPRPQVMSRIEAVTLRRVTASDFVPPIPSLSVADNDPLGQRPEPAAAFSPRHPGSSPGDGVGSFKCEEAK